MIPGVDNMYVLLGTIMRVIAISMLVYVGFKQLSEVLQPRDWLTRLRNILLLTIIFTIVSAIPSLVFQIFRTLGQENETFRNVVSLTGNASYLGMAFLYVLIYRYKGKGK